MNAFHHVHPNRRAVASSLIAAPFIWTSTRAQAQTARRFTPSQTEGPFYPVALPKDSDFDLLKNGNLSYGQGQAAWVSGTVTDIDGKPVWLSWSQDAITLLDPE